MLRTFFLFFLILFLNKTFAQKDTAFVYYELGLKAFNDKQYKKADSLYSLSLNIKMHPDTYYNRALTRMKLNNKQGYCEDICRAATMGDRESDTIFRTDCGSADTAYFDADNKPASRAKHSHFSVVYQSVYPKGNFIVTYRKKAPFPEVNTYTLSPINVSADEVFPEFNGGAEALKAYLAKNIKLPAEVTTKAVSGQVYMNFVVNRLGYLENISVVKGIDKCAACNKEAVRLVSSMPRWKPGVLKGKTEKCSYNLPISFNAAGSN